MSSSTMMIIGGALVVLVLAVAVGFRLARRRSTAEPVQTVPPRTPTRAGEAHGAALGTATEAITDAAERETQVIEGASTDPRSAAELARLKRGNR